MGSGVGMLATPFVSTISAQQTDYEQVVSATHNVAGLATGVSQSGDVVLFGFDDGNVLVYDDRDGAVIPLSVDRSVSHIEVREETNTAVLGWMDADVFGPLDLATGDVPLIEHPGLWDIDTTPDAGLTASVTNPPENPGGVGLADSEGTVRWQTSLDDATGQSVAVSDGGNYIAVGAGRYWENGVNSTGQPGVRLHDRNGTELWRHDHGENVISIGDDAERELVIAGTDDSRIIVLDFDGNVVWQTDAYGGWVVTSADGGTVLTSEPDGTLYALDSATGDEQWTSDIGIWSAEDLSVSADGSRVFAAKRSEAEFAVIEEGETIWSDSHEIGPGRGAIADDGSTWSTIITNLDDGNALLEVYRTDAVTEPRSSPEEVDSEPVEEEPVEEEPSEETTEDLNND